MVSVTAKITIDVSTGDTLELALEAIRLCHDTLELLPDWHERRKIELQDQADALTKHCLEGLYGKKARSEPNDTRRN